MTRPPISRSPPILLLVVLAVAIVLSRTYDLAADPPAWTDADYLTDEGWWADGARGKVFFDDYFADDIGTAFLMAPGYTWSLEAIYRAFGVGLAQTRMLASGAGLATLGLVVLLGFRFAGLRVGILAGALLGVSPFFWVYSRMAFIEPTQGLFMFLAFSAWIALGNIFWGGLLAGVSMGVAVAMKPNTIGIALPALALAAVASTLYQRRLSGDPQPGPVAAIRPGGVLGAALGFSAVGALVFAAVALPHWPEYVRVAIGESGVARRTLRDYATAPGAAFLSVETGESKLLLWRLAHWSPAIFVGVWGYVMDWIARWSSRTSQSGRPSPCEIAVMAWTAMLLLVIKSSPHQPARRFVLVLPGLAILAALYLAKALTVPPAPREEVQTGRSFSRSFPLWIVATFPLLVVVKPAATELVMLATRGLPVGSETGLGYPAAGVLVMLGWLAVAVVPASWGRATAYVSRAVLSRWPAIIVFLLVGYEIVTVGVQLSTARASFVEQQRSLTKYVVEDEIVLGDVAASLFLPYPVRTVRSGDAPPAKPDVWKRLHPRYIVRLTWRNFGPMRRRDQDSDELGRYTLVHGFAVGPTRSGVPRYRFELYEDSALR